jgi:hypothetical protein
LKIVRQHFYRWLAEPFTQAEWDNAHLVNAIMDAHADDPEFGHRLIANEVQDSGITVSDRTVWARRAEYRVWSVFRKRRRRKGGKPGPPVFDDHVQRDFNADAPNELWLTDVTEHRTNEGKLYVCAVKDVFSNGSSDTRSATACRPRWPSTPSRTTPHAAATSRDAWFTPTAAANFVHGSSLACYAATTSSDRRAESARPGITRPWNRSSHSSRRTS